MIYTILNHERRLPDFSKKCTFDTLPECRKKTKEKKIKIEFPLIEKINKEEDKIIGYLNGNVTTMYEEKPMSNYYKMVVNNRQLYCECSEEKKKLHYICGYLQVSTNEFIGVQSSLLPIFIFIGILLLMLIFMLIPGNKDISFKYGNKIEIDENNNIINLDAIPSDTSNIDITQDKAYISGQSLTTVKESYPNVYLQNNKENEKYILVYEVYVEGITDYVYKTGNIPAGQAEPWDAYNCKQIKMGENNISYEVFVYDLEGNQVAQTSLTGLKIIKK